MRHSYLFIIAIMLAVMTPRIAPAQSIAVKSNVLYDLTGTLNLGGEIRCDDTHSFNLSVNYNPWNLGENKKMKHILIQPEYRWWLNETFIGSFFGVQAFIWKKKKKRPISKRFFSNTPSIGPGSWHAPCCA